ncbi:MAG TPA: hypothetical protein VN748_13965 [Pseudonocardiaceae bacterium]|nr:hypothetical protein [Pseudonocardiaceae bacterium]
MCWRWSTKQFLLQADAVIFVTRFNSLLTASDVDFLGEVYPRSRRAFMVINECDPVSAQAAQEGLGFVRRRMQSRSHRVPVTER